MAFQGWFVSRAKLTITCTLLQGQKLWFSNVAFKCYTENTCFENVYDKKCSFSGHIQGVSINGGTPKWMVYSGEGNS